MTKHLAPASQGGSEGANLADLIQLECLSGSREAVLVTSSGRQGHLFFEGGALVDARTEELAGDDAAFEIIGWKTGTFGASSLAWPQRRTITLPWRELLTQAAPDYDQHDRARSARVVAMNTTLRSSIPDSPAPSSANPAASGRRPSVPPRARQPSGTLPVLRRPPAPPPPSSATSMAGAVGAVKRAVRLDDNDTVIAVRGEADELIELGPRLRRAAAELGDVLGLQTFHSFECTFGGRQLMHYRDTMHSTITLEAVPGTNLAAVRSALKR
jgi:hypothetical protein